MPKDGGTAIQEDPDRPVFRGNGPTTTPASAAANVPAEAMGAGYMTYRVRMRWGRCRTVNVSATDEHEPGKAKR